MKIKHPFTGAELADIEAAAIPPAGGDRENARDHANGKDAERRPSGARGQELPPATAKGVSAFSASMRHPGEDDPLDGPQEIIPGIISEGQTGLFPGPPGSGKSFVIIDWLARVAADLSFLDQPVMQGGVAYVVGEGQGGLAKRISAVIAELKLEATSPFIYMHRMPHLLDPQQVSDFIAALKLRTAKWTVPVRLIAFDTLNRSLVGGSEIEGKDIGRLLDADAQIKRAFINCATMFVHHPGKAEGNDTRGHSSLHGDTDVNGIFSGSTGVRSIKIKKNKDGEEGCVFGYSLRQIHLGTHKKSRQPVTTCVVDWVASDVAKAMRSSTTGKWPKGLRLVYDAVTSAILESGREHRVGGDGPAVRAVAVRAARDVHAQRYVSTGDGDAKEAEKKAWQRNFREARNTNLIGGETAGGQELIWIVQS
jgi:hypothetical protein